MYTLVEMRFKPRIWVLTPKGMSLSHISHSNRKVKESTSMSLEADGGVIQTNHSLYFHDVST